MLIKYCLPEECEAACLKASPALAQQKRNRYSLKSSTSYGLSPQAELMYSTSFYL